MYTMKEVCEVTQIPYETLRFYCNEGLVPNIRRDKNNYRIFDDRNIEWIKSLKCLKKCGMGIKDMKAYLALCLEGPSSIPERKRMLDAQKGYLLDRVKEINESVAFIEGKQAFYDGVLSGSVKYRSNIIEVEE